MIRDRASYAPRLLVVGGTGRLGRLLRRAWHLDDGGVHCLWQARREGQGGDLVFDPADGAAFADAAARADVILNLAGAARGDTAALADHAVLARAASVAGQRQRVPLLQASSAAVYGGGAALSEQAQLRPVAAYGRAKCAMEAAVSSAPGVTCLRIANVAGADALLGQEGAARVLDIFPDGHPSRRSYIGPQALATALSRLARAAARGVALPRAINLALPGVVGLADLLEAAGLFWTPRNAPGDALPLVGLDVTRALALSLVPPPPATAAAVLADLRGLPPEAAA